jgi:hypothetical protein
MQAKSLVILCAHVLALSGCGGGGGGPDTATSHSVKEDITIEVGGMLPATGYAVSREILLENISL